MARTIHARRIVMALQDKGWHESEIARILRHCRRLARTRGARSHLDALLTAHADMGLAS